MKVGMLTSGGDCAGLNAVMRAIALNLYTNVKMWRSSASATATLG